MDKLTAAQLLGVAEYTVGDIEFDLQRDGWVVTVRDMASHEDAERFIPGELAAPPSEWIAPDEAVVEEDAQVPDGNVQEVLDWAAVNVTRARAALAAELAKDRSRKGVTEPLEALVAAAEEQGL